MRNIALSYEPCLDLHTKNNFLPFFSPKFILGQKKKKILSLVVEYGLTSFALVPVGTNASTCEQCLDIRTKNSRYGLNDFQCIPMGNGALPYKHFDV